eukprot:gene4398-6670_t
MHAHCIQTPEEINCDSVDSATYKLPRPLNSSEDRQLLLPNHTKLLSYQLESKSNITEVLKDFEVAGLSVGDGSIPGGFQPCTSPSYMLSQQSPQTGFMCAAANFCDSAASMLF